MPNINAKAGTFSCQNYLGELYEIGQKNTPFLTMIGGLTGGGKQVTGFQFPVSQEWSLNAADQPAISEDDAVTAPNPTTYVRSQKYNTCQIFHRAVTITYAKQSSAGALSGINIEGRNPVRDEKSFQIEGNLKQVAKDVEHTFLNGKFQEAAASNVAAKTRGMIEAVTTNVVDAGNSALTIAMIKDLVRSMADNGAPFDQPVLFAGSAKIQQISDLYKTDDQFHGHERNIGGVAVKTILTDFVELGVVWAPAMPADAVLIADNQVIGNVGSGLGGDRNAANIGDVKALATVETVNHNNDGSTSNNLELPPSADANGRKPYDVALKNNVSLDSVTINMRGRPITNLKAGVASGDAVNVSQLEDLIGQSRSEGNYTAGLVVGDTPTRRGGKN